MKILFALSILAVSAVHAQIFDPCENDTGICGMLEASVPLAYQATKLCEDDPTAPYCTTDADGDWTTIASVVNQVQDEFFTHMCILSDHHCATDAPPGTCVVGDDSDSICFSSYSYTITFTETGKSCNRTAAYWEARNDIDRYCEDGRGGAVIPTHAPFYEVVSLKQVVTGSCHDPNGGNGLGTRYTYKLRAECNAPKPGYEHLF